MMNQINVIFLSIELWCCGHEVRGAYQIEYSWPNSSPGHGEYKPLLHCGKLIWEYQSFQKGPCWSQMWL
jgi:hypothetical protein